MLVSKDQLDKMAHEINEAFKRQERMIDELRDKLEKLEKKKPGRPPKEAA